MGQEEAGSLLQVGLAWVSRHQPSHLPRHLAVAHWKLRKKKFLRNDFQASQFNVMQSRRSGKKYKKIGLHPHHIDVTPM